MFKIRQSFKITNTPKQRPIIWAVRIGPMWIVGIRLVFFDGWWPVVIINILLFIGVGRDMADVPTQVADLEAEFCGSVFARRIKENGNVFRFATRINLLFEERPVLGTEANVAGDSCDLDTGVKVHVRYGCQQGEIYSVGHGA